MSIDEISKEIKKCNEDATKSSEDMDKVLHLCYKECECKNKVLTGLMKDVNQQNEEVKLREGCYEILSSLQCQEYA